MLLETLRAKSLTHFPAFSDDFHRAAKLHTVKYFSYNLYATQRNKVDKNERKRVIFLFTAHFYRNCILKARNVFV